MLIKNVILKLGLWIIFVSDTKIHLQFLLNLTKKPYLY